MTAKTKLDYQYNDGGRAEAGRKGSTGDCVAGAITIASGRPYKEVYDRLAEGNATQRASKRTPKRSKSASSGINVTRKWFKDYMHELGFEWVSVMGIGTGCTTNLCKQDLPKGNLVVSVSKHYCAVIDHVLNDTYDHGGERVRGNP